MKHFILALLFLFIAAIIVQFFSIFSKDPIAAKICKQTTRMARLTAYLNHLQRMGELGDYDVNRSMFDLDTGWVFQGFEGIQFATIQEDERKGKLKSIDWYLFDEKLGVGMLCNGMLFKLPFDPKRIERFLYPQNACD